MGIEWLGQISLRLSQSLKMGSLLGVGYLGFRVGFKNREIVGFDEGVKFIKIVARGEDDSRMAFVRFTFICQGLLKVSSCLDVGGRC